MAPVAKADVDPDDARTREELRRFCLCGDVASVVHLLDIASYPMDAVLDEHEGFTGLHLAARGGHLQLTQDLLQRGCPTDCADAHQQTPLHLACMEGHADIVLELILSRADVDAADDTKQTALHKVVRTGDNLDLVRVLVENGSPQLTAIDCTQATVLHAGAELGKHNILSFLAAKAPELLPMENEHGWTALHLAAHGRELRPSPFKASKFGDSVRKLLDARALVDAVDEDRKTPLHRASYTGNLATVTALLEGGAEVDAEDICRWLPLHYAVQGGHKEVVHALLKARALVQRNNPPCLTPLAVATLENEAKIAELLMKYGADPQLRGKGLASPIMIARKEPEKHAELLSLFELGFISHQD